RDGAAEHRHNDWRQVLLRTGGWAAEPDLPAPGLGVRLAFPARGHHRRDDDRRRGGSALGRAPQPALVSRLSLRAYPLARATWLRARRRPRTSPSRARSATRRWPG